MARRVSTVAEGWWDYTTLDDDLLADAARLTPEQMLQLSRPGFKVVFYDTLEDFYLAEALEYITAWRQSTPDNPVGICGPIGPTEQLPLVARLVNALALDVRSGPFLGHGRVVRRGQGGPAHASALLRAGGPRAVLRSHRQEAAHERRQPALSQGQRQEIRARAGTVCVVP